MIVWPLITFLGVALGTFLVLRERLIGEVTDRLIRKGRLRGVTRPEIAYQHGLRDSVTLLEAERELRRLDMAERDEIRAAFLAAMRNIASCRKASEARKYAREQIRALESIAERES